MTSITATSKVRLFFVVLGLGIGVTAISAASAEAALTFSFTKKLDLNPRPFADAAHNAYWRGRKKYSNSHDVWEVTTTLHVDAKFPNTPIPGVIAIDNIHFQAVNTRTGELHQVNLHRFISALDNSVVLTNDGGTGSYRRPRWPPSRGVRFAVPT